MFFHLDLFTKLVVYKVTSLELFTVKLGLEFVYVEQGSASKLLFNKWPDSEYFRLCGPHSFILFFFLYSPQFFKNIKSGLGLRSIQNQTVGLAQNSSLRTLYIEPYSQGRGICTLIFHPSYFSAMTESKYKSLPFLSAFLGSN